MWGRWRSIRWILMLGAGWLLVSCSQPMPQPTYEVPGGDVDRGRQAFTEYGCGACHTIPGVTDADATVGPPLTGWGKRAAIAGEFPNTPDYLIAWLQHPQAMRPGTIMPEMGVTEGAARDMSAYLYTLQRGPAEPPWH